MSLTQKPAQVSPRDWAWRKGQRYGTILCDLERRRVVDLLPDRQSNPIKRQMYGRAKLDLLRIRVLHAA
jgi:transposase